LVKLWYEWNWDAARVQFERAITLDPTNPIAHFEYGWYLAALGRLDEGLAETKRTVELDPASALLNKGLAIQLYCLRRFDESIEQARKANDLQSGIAQDGLGSAYAAKGMYREAVAELSSPDGYRDASVRMRSGDRGRGWGSSTNSRLVKDRAPRSGGGHRLGLRRAGGQGPGVRLAQQVSRRRTGMSCRAKTDPIWDPLRSTHVTPPS
jgi:hypothetical protein